MQHKRRSLLRYLLLVAFNLLQMWLFFDVLEPARHHLRADWQMSYYDWFLKGFQLSIALPISILSVHLLPDSVRLVLGLLNPLLWAAGIEWGLRRFVDRPKDSDAG